MLIYAIDPATPLEGDNVIVGAVVYPDPGFVIVIDEIGPFATFTLAIAVAFTSELPGG